MDMIFQSSQIADLHCDLLCYLARNKKHSAYDPAVRCSIPQLRQGNVKIQVMAIFNETKPKSSESGLAQASVFKSLPMVYPNDFVILRSETDFAECQNNNKIGILAAIENAAGFAEEGDTWDEILHKFSSLQRKCGKFAYISLTWNMENRFGGGAGCDVGLKPDGMRLIELMAEKKIPLDISHASDRLAFDIFDYIDKKNHKIPVIASHSNMRQITNVPRNLPTELAKEIIYRKGLIGLNFIPNFVGKDPLVDFSKHLALLIEWGGISQASLGADFYHDDDLNPAFKVPGHLPFFPSFDSASAYPKLLHLYKTQLGVSQQDLDDVAYHNIVNFFKNFVGHA